MPLAVTLLTVIPQAIKGLGHFRDTKPAQKPGHSAQTGVISLLEIEQREPSNRPPRLLSVPPLVFSFLMLAFSIWAISMWVAGMAEFQVGFWLVIFLALFIGLPFFIIWDHFFIQRKYYKLGRSHVAKEARITVANDAETVFDACCRALDSMQAAVSILRKPNLLKAKVRNSVMVITITQIEGSKVRVYIRSDSKWLTVRWDMGANQRNIDSFLQEFGKQ